MGGFGGVQTVPLFYGMRETGRFQAGKADMLSAKTEAPTAAGF
jgi:hypothetical protein